jgi:hypothetical protein
MAVLESFKFSFGHSQILFDGSPVDAYYGTDFDQGITLSVK